MTALPRALQVHGSDAEKGIPVTAEPDVVFRFLFFVEVHQLNLP